MKKTFTILLMLFFFQLHSCSQDKYDVDSLLSAWKTAKEDTNKGFYRKFHGLDLNKK